MDSIKLEFFIFCAVFGGLRHSGSSLELSEVLCLCSLCVVGISSYYFTLRLLEFPNHF